MSMSSSLVADFVRSRETTNGYGFWEGIPAASERAVGLSKRQKRRYQRYGVVPSDFFDFLEDLGFRITGTYARVSGCTEDDLPEVLAEHLTCKTREASEVAEYLVETAVFRNHPELRKCNKLVMRWKKRD
jgi:hypothetical protein